MGCDFYCYPFLEIVHKGGTCYVELPLGRGYFDYDFSHPDQDEDEDEETFMNSRRKKEYDKLFGRYLRLTLEKRVPIPVYENGEFRTPQLSDKYKECIDEKIACNKRFKSSFKGISDKGTPLQRWDDIVSIRKLQFFKEI
jgi:hypothetical protein